GGGGDRVGQYAGASLVGGVPVGEGAHVLADGRGLGQVGEVRERAALHEAPHLEVVVQAAEVRRVVAHEARREVRGDVVLDGEGTLRVGELRGEAREVGDGLGLGLIQGQLRAAAAARAGGQRRRRERAGGAA